MKIAIVDLGVGNLRSVEQAVMSVAPNAEVVLADNASTLLTADKVVLPGQGAVGTWFRELQERDLTQALNTCIAQKPLLGICVGMQALFESCEEDGGVSGLGLFRGNVRHFKHFHQELAEDGPRLKIPQMGWNQVFQLRDHPLWHGIEDNAHFYFVHSYCANTAPDSDLGVVYGGADYGHKFISAVGRNNVFAVQFHPEKSHDNGLRLLKNFTQWDGKAE